MSDKIMRPCYCGKPIVCWDSNDRPGEVIVWHMGDKQEEKILAPGTTKQLLDAMTVWLNEVVHV